MNKELILLDIKKYVKANYVEIKKEEKDIGVRFSVGVRSDWLFYEEEDVKEVIEKIKKIKLEKNFNELLFKFIDEKGLTDVETYKKANVDRRHFSKIKSNKNYLPTATTIIKFGFALELTLEELELLLKSAGKSLSNNSKFDVIVKYFFENHIYNIDFFNEVCLKFNSVGLGDTWRFIC